MKELIKHIYETQADMKPLPSLREQEIIRNRLRHRFRKYLPADKHARMLDIGAGDGMLISTLKQMGYDNITGVEISEHRIERARKLGVTDIVHIDAMEYLDSHANEFRVIFALDVIEHFSRQNLIAFVNLVYQALQPGGIFIIHTVNTTLLSGYRDVDLTHECGFTPESLTQLLTNAGFIDIEILESGFEPVNFKTLIRKCLWNIVKIPVMLFFIILTGSVQSGIYTLSMLGSGKKPVLHKDTM